MKPPDNLPIEPGDVIQLDPEHHEMYGGCLFVVRMIKPWGVQAYTMIPRHAGTRRRFMRLPTGSFVRIGKVQWE